MKNSVALTITKKFENIFEHNFSFIFVFMTFDFNNQNNFPCSRVERTITVISLMRPCI